MENVEYKKIADFEKSYWWHLGKIHLLNSLLNTYLRPSEKPLIMEIGCGTGEVLKALAKRGEVIGLDISTQALSFSKKLGMKNLILGDFNELDLTPYKNKLDAVVALDVLEHIQADLKAIKRVHEILKKDGLFFVNVPAHKFLWSEHDEALHHKRRYRMNEITKKLEDGGFKVIKRTYFVSFAFPAIAFFRVWSNFFGRNIYPKTSYVLLPAFLNSLMLKMLKFEAFIVTHGFLPMGTTVAIVAQRR
ncbi:MAG: class I SAM-dependent methyltransferase [Patescibacteria group bacterium]